MPLSKVVADLQVSRRSKGHELNHLVLVSQIDLSGVSQQFLVPNTKTEEAQGEADRYLIEEACSLKEMNQQVCRFVPFFTCSKTKLSKDIPRT